LYAFAGETGKEVHEKNGIFIQLNLEITAFIMKNSELQGRMMKWLLLMIPSEAYG
jgi:hypothetical protein